MLFGLIMGLSVQLNGVAKLLSIIAGFHYGIIIAGLFTLSYASMGGFKAASLTDVLQGPSSVLGL